MANFVVELDSNGRRRYTHCLALMNMHQLISCLEFNEQRQVQLLQSEYQRNGSLSATRFRELMARYRGAHALLLQRLGEKLYQEIILEQQAMDEKAEELEQAYSSDVEASGRIVYVD